MKVAIRYQDDGPGAFAGQVVGITSPLDHLHVFPDEGKAREYMRKIEDIQNQSGGKGRKNPRITAIWYCDEHSPVNRMFEH